MEGVLIDACTIEKKKLIIFMLDQLTDTDFQPLLQQEFVIGFTNDLKLEAELIEVSKLGEDPTDGKRHPFSLVFRTTEKKPFPQATYPVAHPRFGEMEIFLVPIGPDRQGMRYEAVFT